MEKLVLALFLSRKHSQEERHSGAAELPSWHRSAKAIFLKMDESVGAPHPSWNSARILFLDPEDAVYSSPGTEELHPRRVDPHELNLYSVSESCFRAFPDCMSFSGPGSGVPLTNILPKAVLPLTDVSDSYGTRKPTSLSRQASCTEITAKLLGFFPSSPRTERKEARARQQIKGKKVWTGITNSGE